MPSGQTWEAWYDETLDALVSQVVNADVDWSTDGDGNPWVVKGQRRPKGILYPHAMILQFTKQRDEANSMRTNELHNLSTSVSVFREGDIVESEANLDRAIADMGAIEDSLYADRSLGGTCRNVTITQADAFSLDTSNGHETVGNIQLSILKHAYLEQ